MERDQIREQCSYRTANGLDLYVQSVDGQRVVYVHVGQIVRHESSLGCFAALADQQIPNR